MSPPRVEETPRFQWRFRLLSCCLVLVAVAFSQRPGRLVSDTKLDLAVDPLAMLGRSLHLWDPLGGFGQVQNQAYGYLFPMGPFFAAGDLLAVPDWAVQRLWWSLLLVVAFLGVVKLCGELGLGTPTARLIGGFAYALSPRILTTLGPISVEAWPTALVPWVLVPLVAGSVRGSPRRAAALSALAVACVGGVNAAATFAVVPLGVLWLLTREPGPRRRALMLWWPPLVLVATAWWLVPLLLLGQYSPPFLDYIETASITTFPTTVVDVLRGTSHWVPYVDPSWRAGNDVLTQGWSLLNSAVLLTLGAVGLMIRGNPHRQFLVLALLLGLVTITAGHDGAVVGGLSGTVRDLLDGSLAPLRNVHKFDPWVRLPLVLGLVHLVGVVGSRGRGAPGRRAPGSRPRAGMGSWGDDSNDRVTAFAVTLVTVVALVGSVGPALTGRLAPTDDFERVPAYWGEAADWLADDPGRDPGETGGVALLVPGSSFATYLWGTPEDEPLQALGRSRWAVRNAVPLAPPGNIRMLDAIEERLAAGRSSPGLADFLARAGIDRLVVRSDLRGPEPVEPVLVHQAIDGSPGLRRVASFGPAVEADVRLDRGGEGPRLLLEGGWVESYRPVEIYAVEPTGANRTGARVGPPSLVVGGPEDLLTLADQDLLGQQPTVLATDVEPDVDVPADVLLTDGLRRKERNFARIRDGRSATLGAGEEGRRGAPARDYTLGSAEEEAVRWQTFARTLGVADLEASSSRAFADTPGPVRPEALPFAAFDGLVDSAWDSGPVAATETAWIEVELEDSRRLSTVSVLVGESKGVDLAEGDDVSQAFRVRTDAGVTSVHRGSPETPVTVGLPSGETRHLRVEATERGAQLSIAEVTVPGTDVDRTLVMPEVPAAWGPPRAVVLDAQSGQRGGCVEIGGDVRCSVDRERTGEEPGFVDRTIRLGSGADYAMSLTVRPVSGDALLGLIQQGLLVNAAASSTAGTDPRSSAFAAIDGRPGTTWVADPEDPNPTLTLRWVGDRTVRGISLRLDREAPAGQPREVRLRFPGGERLVEIDERGNGRFAPFRADSVSIEVTRARRAESRRTDGSIERLGVGMGEVRLTGLGLLPAVPSDVPRDIGCSFGPTVRVGTEIYGSAVTASPRELAEGVEVPARLCGPEVPLNAGETRVVLGPAPAFRPLGAVLRRADDGPTGGPSGPAGTLVEVQRTDEVRGTVRLPTYEAGSVLALPENANAGWEATTSDGVVLRPTLVDGWQQGWWLPPDIDVVSFRFAPDGVYRAALALGGGALLVLALPLLVQAVRPGRRRRLEQGGPPGLATRRLPWPLLAGIGLVAAWLVAGWPGLAVAAATTAVVALVRGRAPRDWIAALAGLPLLTAALVSWARPWGSTDGWAGSLSAPQLLALVTVSAVAALEPDRWRPRSFHRITGRSTER